jgi:excisionase family DNA binding protein
VGGVLEAQTYAPEPSREQVAEVRSFLAAHADRRGSVPAPRFLLAGDAEGEQIELPETVYRVLVQVVEALAAGKAVTVTQQEPQLTTQQVADLLGVSRPTVVRMIESGELSAERNGSRRRVLLSDALAYRERRRQRQYAMLAATAVDIDDEDDHNEMIERIRQARAAVAEQRRR